MTGPRSEREVAQAMHAVAEAPPGLEAHREGRRRGLGFFEAILHQASLPIAVLRDGAVAECGTHDALMRRGGYYSELYRAQFDAAQDVG